MRRILAFLLMTAILLTVMPVVAIAETTPAVSVSSHTVRQGNSVTVRISAENCAQLSMLELNLYYDSEAFTVSNTSKGGLVSSTSGLFMVDDDTPGQLHIFAMDALGMSDSATVLSITFRVSETAAVKTHSLRLAVGETYDMDRKPVTVGSTGGSLTVTEKTTTVTTFRLSSTVNQSSGLEKGDQVRFVLRNSSRYSFASGEFTVGYDSNLFAVESVELAQQMLTEDAVYSVNTNIRGSVLMAYSAVNAVNAYEVMTVTLKVIADVDTSTTISYSCANVYREDRTAYAPYSGSYSLYLTKLPEVIDHPDIWVAMQRHVVGKSGYATVMLEQGAGVAAGDFTITYDPAVLQVTDVVPAADVEAIGGQLMVNDDFKNGTIRFSYIHEEGYQVTQFALLQIQWTALQAPTDHTQVTMTGKMVYDKQYNPLTLEYPAQTGCVYVPEVIAPTCTSQGYTVYTCPCGEQFEDDYVAAAAHTYERNPLRCDHCGEERTVNSVLLTAVPQRSEYKVGQQQADLTGGMLQVTFADGGSAVVDAANAEVTAFNTTFAGSCAVILTLGGKTVSYSVQVLLWGDVNRDGAVDLLDSMYLDRYFANWGGFDAQSCSMIAADVNDDGVTDLLDSMILARHLANWAGYETLPYEN